MAIPPSAWRGRTGNDDGNTALTLITAGGDPGNDDLAGPMQPTPWLAKCPYAAQVLDALGATWGRARLMRLSTRAEVKAHVDVNYYWRDRMRVHVPIVTSAGVRFQCGDEEINMRAGECWIFDTWRRHRVVNEGEATRIHLVADTVGGPGLWNLRAGGRPSRGNEDAWSAPMVTPRSNHVPDLDFERFNAPVVMSPWELREHILFLLGEAIPAPQLGPAAQVLQYLSRTWRALWACHGEDRAGWVRYRELLASVRAELVARGVGNVGLANQIGLMQALDAYVFDVAVSDRGGGLTAVAVDQHGVDDADPIGAAVAPSVQKRASTDPVFDRPVFIVSPPRSGSTLLFETLALADGVFTIGDESHHTIEGIASLTPAARHFESNQLGAEDALPETAEKLRSRFFGALRDAHGRHPGGASVRMLEKTPKNALRIPFLCKVFPEARFIYLHRDPRQVLGSMMDGWLSGGFITYPQLPEWVGPSWSFLLTPGWRELIGKPLGDIVSAQWQTTTRILLDDLHSLPAGRWLGVDHDQFIKDPQEQVARICAWADWPWTRQLQGVLPLSRYTLTPPSPDKWRRHADLITPRMAAMEATVERAARFAEG